MKARSKSSPHNKKLQSPIHTNIDPMSETCQQLAKKDQPFAAFENLYSSKLMLSVSLSNCIVHILNEST